MSPEMFSSIIGMIENHAVFHNLSMNDQAPIEFAVFLAEDTDEVVINGTLPSNVTSPPPPPPPPLVDIFVVSGGYFMIA
jgi:hypothetical protein